MPRVGGVIAVNGVIPLRGAGNPFAFDPFAHNAIAPIGVSPKSRALLPLPIDPSLVLLASPERPLTPRPMSDQPKTPSLECLKPPKIHALISIVTSGSPAAFIVKFNQAASALIYSTYLGGPYGMERKGRRSPSTVSGPLK